MIPQSIRPRPGISVSDLDGELYFDTFCIVCGIPITVLPEIQRLDTSNSYQWCLDAVALHAQNPSQEHLEWDEQRYHGHGKPISIIPVEGNFVFHQMRVSSGNALNEHAVDDPWLGMHRKCFDMMQRLLEYRVKVLHLTPNNALRVEGISPYIPASLGEMYELYHARLENGKHPNSLDSMYVKKVLEPHRYYYYDGDEKKVDLFSEHTWPFGSPDTMEYEVAPFPILNLLRQILAYLKPLPAGATSITAPSLQAKLDSLPIEIQMEIYQNIHPLTDPPIECSRTLLPSTWKELLFHRQLLPWLWDLGQPETADFPRISMSDENANTSMQTSDNENVWDWELLVRQLAQLDSFEPGGVMESLPCALRNRRRIWRLLDEARRDDTDKFKMWPNLGIWDW